jgi:hypothetical protein
MDRLQLAGAAALLALSIGVFAARCATDPAIPFVSQDADAPWIAYPAPPTGWMGLAPRDAPPVTTYRRSFRVPPTGTAEARLRVRAMRAFQLWVNGVRLGSGPDPDHHWRGFQRFGLGEVLRPGENEIRVEVTNPTGPPLLALRLDGLPDTVVSDASWSVTPEDGPTRPATRVGTERVNPSSYSMPSPAEALGTRGDGVLAIFVVSAALLLAGQSLGHRLPPAAGSLGPWRLAARVLPALVVLAWSALFLATLLEIPIEVGFDARQHVAYVDFLREHHALPLATDGWMMFHPPVYYAPTAALVELQRALAPGSGSLLGWKLMGFLSGLGSALLCWAVARRIFGEGAREVVFATVFAATLPMNLYISAYVTNESLHAALASGIVLATVALLLAPGPRPGALLVWAVLVSLAVLTKYTAWIPTSVAAFFLAVRWWRVDRTPPGAVARRLAVAGAVVVTLAGWFYVRNLLHFGQLFPLNVDLPGQANQWWSQPGYYTPDFFLRFGSVLSHPFLAGFHTAWDSFYSTLWGDGQLAGQMVARARHPHWDYEWMAVGYWLAVPATALLALGAGRGLWLAFRHPDPGHRAVHSFLLTLAYALFLSVLFMTLRQQDYGQAKAFYALASIAPLSVFFALGCGAVDAWLEARRAGWARVLFGAWLATFAAVLWLSYRG